VTYATPRASFDRVSGGFRFTLRFQPRSEHSARGTVILAPAFAEEMNRCRRMTTLAARRLAQQGWRILARDLHGCGDSSGDFGDASWQDWIDDLQSLVDETPADEPLWLWGVRAGALLVPELLAQRADANVLLWQPVISGHAALSQFLRLKTAAAALAGKERVDVKSLRAVLAAGSPVEVAGYMMSPDLASGYEAAALKLPADFRGRIVWLEVANAQPATLSPSGDGVRNDWRARGRVVDAEAVAGEQFWQTQETAECPALLDATERLIGAGR
jgi:exosortase A-associated hydrolase 2